MSRRRCCCGEEPPSGPIPCNPCPDPIAPATVTRWSISVTASGIEGVSDGSGALVTGGVVKSCQRGSCGSVTFKEKAVGNDTFSMIYCDETDYCNAMRDATAPTNSGSSHMEWTTCMAPDGEDVGGPYYPDIAYTFNDHVRIIGAAATSRFIPGIPGSDCAWVNTSEEDTDCRSIVEVVYTFTNSFDYPFFQDNGPGQECDQTTSTISTTQSWICVYSKRPTGSQYWALGSYPLVKVTYPTAAHTYGPIGTTCGIPGGVVCSANGLDSVTSPTPWQPPSSVTVVRVA
jgi:hypothetical protein